DELPEPAAAGIKRRHEPERPERGRGESPDAAGEAVSVQHHRPGGAKHDRASDAGAIGGGASVQHPLFLDERAAMSHRRIRVSAVLIAELEERPPGESLAGTRP